MCTIQGRHNHLKCGTAPLNMIMDTFLVASPYIISFQKCHICYLIASVKSFFFFFFSSSNDLASPVSCFIVVHKSTVELVRLCPTSYKVVRQKPYQQHLLCRPCNTSEKPHRITHSYHGNTEVYTCSCTLTLKPMNYKGALIILKSFN